MRLFGFKSNSGNKCNTGDEFVDRFMNKSVSENIAGKRFKILAIAARDALEVKISSLVDRDISAIVENVVQHSLRSFNKPVERERLLEMVYESPVYENLHDIIRMFLMCSCETDDERNFIVNLAKVKGQTIKTISQYEELSVLSFLYLLAVHFRILLTDSTDV